MIFRSSIHIIPSRYYCRAALIFQKRIRATVEMNLKAVLIEDTKAILV